MSDVVEYRVSTADEATAMVDELAALYANDFVDPPLKGTFFYSDARFRARLLDNYAKRPGFIVTTARVDDELIGFADGCPLSATNYWWKNARETLPSEFITENGKRTFAIFDIVVKKEWRDRKVARALHAKLLENRPEERVTLLSTTDTQPGYSMWQHYGYKKVATAEPAKEGTILDVFVRNLK